MVVSKTKTEARSTLVFEYFVFETTGFVFEIWVLCASVFVFECFVFEATEIYSTNLAINVGGLAHLSFLLLITCGDIYKECNCEIGNIPWKVRGIYA